MRREAVNAVAAESGAVVVGVDGSEPGRRAVEWGADEAARHGRTLLLVCAMGFEPYEAFVPPDATPEEIARGVLTEARELAVTRQPGLVIEHEIRTGDPVVVLTEAGTAAFLIVVGQRGRGTLNRMLLGSVSLGTAGRAVCPTVVVRGAENGRRGRFGRVVLGVDGTEQAADAVEFAFREAAAREASLTAVHAWHRGRGGPEASGAPPEGTLLADAVAGAARAYPQVRLSPEYIEGSAREVLLREAETADLLVVGAHHRHAVVGLRLGLVSHALLHHSPCPVAVVPRRPR